MMPPAFYLTLFIYFVGVICTIVLMILDVLELDNFYATAIFWPVWVVRAIYRQFVAKLNS